MDIHTTTTPTSNGWYGGVRYDTPTGQTHCLGRHGRPSERDADRYARELAKRIKADHESSAAESADPIDEVHSPNLRRKTSRSPRRSPNR